MTAVPAVRPHPGRPQRLRVELLRIARPYFFTPGGRGIVTSRRHARDEYADSRLVIGFDGDDTLWHNEQLFADTQDQLRELLGHYADMATIDSKLLEIERRNLAIFGYGVKGFVLSMIETAIEISDATISAQRHSPDRDDGQGVARASDRVVRRGQ